MDLIVHKDGQLGSLASMGRIFALSLLVMIVFGSNIAQGYPRSKAETTEEIKNAILQKEEEQNEALRKNDAASLGSMCTEEIAWTNASGVLLSKAQMLADLRSGKQKNSSIKHEDLRLHVYGDTVVVTGISTSRYLYNGKEFVGARRFTNVWVRQRDGWLLAVHHVTPIVQKSAN